MKAIIVFLYISLPEVSGVAHDIWKMTFYTPEPVSMVLREAQQAGYGAMSTPNRLVVRSPYTTAETNAETVSLTQCTPVNFPSFIKITIIKSDFFFFFFLKVAGIPMEVLRVSIYYKSRRGLSVMNLAAACPTGELWNL